uniref:Uncharacterized protein n=1 Tax=Stomoxys calcitrans TaxID=35570 RepID=A0A1I8PH96_STOCA
MKFLIIFGAMLAVALAAPAGNENAEIVKLQSDVQAEGYSFLAELSDGSTRQEEGKLKDVGSEYPAISVQGSYSWKDPADGKVYKVNYVADENGYRPTGDHLPPLPAAPK